MRRSKHGSSFAERVAEHAKKIRDRAANLPPGEERDALIEKLQLTKTAIEITKALTSANSGNLDAPVAFRLK